MEEFVQKIKTNTCHGTFLKCKNNKLSNIEEIMNKYKSLNL